MSLDAWFINWTPLSPSNDFRTVFGGKRENGDIVVGGGGPESETPVSLDQVTSYLPLQPGFVLLLSSYANTPGRLSSTASNLPSSGSTFSICLSQ